MEVRAIVVMIVMLITVINFVQTCWVKANKGLIVAPCLTAAT